MGIKFENGQTVRTPDRTYQPVVNVPNKYADNIEQMETILLPLRGSALEAREEICQFLDGLTDVDPKEVSPYIERSDGVRKMLWGKLHPAYGR